MISMVQRLRCASTSSTFAKSTDQALLVRITQAMNNMQLTCRRKHPPVANRPDLGDEPLTINQLLVNRGPSLGVNLLEPIDEGVVRLDGKLNRRFIGAFETYGHQ